MLRVILTIEMLKLSPSVTHNAQVRSAQPGLRSEGAAARPGPAAGGPRGQGLLRQRAPELHQWEPLHGQRERRAQHQ